MAGSRTTIEEVREEPKGGTGLPSREEEFASWYEEVVRSAGLAGEAPVRGGLVLGPYGFRIWELIREAVDDLLRRTGHRNVAFPLLVPGSDLDREPEDGGGPARGRAALVTRAGGEDLTEPVAVRPPGGAGVWPVAGRWIDSHRDLPLLLNEWARVVSWESAPRPLVVTRESLRQVGHTAHASAEEAEAQARRMIGEYRKLMDRWMALAVVTGEAPPAHRGPGADRSWLCEILAGGGRMLRIGSQRFLGRNAARSFDLRYRTEDGGEELAWNTSGGVSSRLIGALAMAHGDDRGLVLPPRLAPHQVVIVPVGEGDGRRTLLLEVSRRIRRVLSREVRVHVDDRADAGPEERAREWELRGVPLRIEVDPEGVSRQRVDVVRRFGGSGPRTLKEAEALSTVPRILERMQRELAAAARDRRDEATLRRPGSWDAFVDRMEGRGGLVYAGWCGSSECRERAEREAGATVRLLPDPDFRGEPAPETCLACGGDADAEALWARGM